MLGRFDGLPRPNPDEIDEWKWIAPQDLREDVARHPQDYTPWFQIALDQVLRHAPDL